MSIKDNFAVYEIPNKQAKPWILKKHYANRLPSISYAFGLYRKDEIVGVCTFGYPPNYNFNNGDCVFENYSVETFELNRLITEDDLPKNALSYFVSQCLKLLPSPSCVVSYSDPNEGHHGYIYQATNWIYTGTSTPKHRYHFEDGSVFDIRRGIDIKQRIHGEIVEKEKLKPTHRYLYFVGNKREKKKMLDELKYDIKPYPKGDNKEYDTGDKIHKQLRLF